MGTGASADDAPAGTRLAGAVVRRLVLRARVRQGVARVRASFWPVIQAGFAAAVAYGLSGWILDHRQPFFAAIAAWACLGFSFDRELRRIAEVALGVTLGVAAGDLAVRILGSGLWQLSTVLVVSALLARFIDRGPLLAVQAGTQAIVIVGLPALTGGPFGRAWDAAVGGLVALAVALLTPGDPRRRLRTLGGAATSSLADVLARTSTAIRAADAEALETTLVAARASDPELSEWHDRVQHATRQARLSVNRVHRDELERLVNQAVLVDRAMRTVRVLLRRAPFGVTHASQTDLDSLADLLARTAVGVRELASAIDAGHDPAAAQATLTRIAADADPRSAAADWGIQALVLLLRSPVVDLLEASGATPEEARQAFTEL